MKQFVHNVFHQKLEELIEVIERDNARGNLDGLFSRYVLFSFIDLPWNVIIDQEWLEQNKETLEQGNYIQLAVLGYSLSLGEVPKQSLRIFATGLKRLQSKEQFPGDRISFPFYPREFLGLTLGVKKLESSRKEEYRKWLLEILFQRKKLNIANPLQKIIYLFIETLLTKNSIEISSYEIKRVKSYGEVSLLYWGIKKGAFRVGNEQVIHTIRKRILEGFLEKNSDVENWLTPIILYSTKSCFLESIDPLVLSPDHVSRLLRNFESAMRRWPSSEKEKWVIKDEKDVQSILWLILRSVFDDVIDEEPTPRFGHGYSLVDFRIPSLKLLVEVKFVRKRQDFNKIENEIKIDSINYLKTTDCKELIVFVYDDSASVEEHQTTIQSLKRIDGVRDVIIASRPARTRQSID